MLRRMHPIAKNVLLTVVKFAIPLIIVGYLYANIPPEKWEKLVNQPKNYGLLTLALAVALGSVCVSFTRWCLLVRCQRIELPMIEAFRLGSIGFLLNFVSVGAVGGDLFKAIFLARRYPKRKFEAVGSVLVDRAVGLFGLVLLVAATLIVAPPQVGQQATENLQQIQLGTIVLLVGGISTLLFLVLGGRSVDRLIAMLSKLRVVGPFIGRIGSPLRMFHRHPVALFVSIVMSVCIHCGFTSSMYLIARGLYADSPTLAEHFIIVPIGLLASALPITPAGLGVFEGTVDWLYNNIPASPTLASGMMVALVFEIVKVIVAMIGTIFYWTAGDEVRDTLDDASHEAVPERPAA